MQSKSILAAAMLAATLSLTPAFADDMSTDENQPAMTNPDDSQDAQGSDEQWQPDEPMPDDPSAQDPADSQDQPEDDASDQPTPEDN